MLKRLLSTTKRFGIWYGIIVILDYVSRHSGEGKIYQRIHKYKYKLVKKFILENYYFLPEAGSDTNSLIEDTKYIWIFWWQGLDNAPSIVKKCILNVIKKEKDKKVVIITKQNYSKYVSISSNIINKVESGKFTLTFFSDILRFTLLSEYGGIWMDSTIYLRNSLPNDINSYSFYTVKHNLYSNWHIAGGKWSSFFLCAGRNNYGVKVIKNILTKYAENEDIIMAYLLTDAVMSVVYDKIPSFKKEVDTVPINNIKVFQMEDDLNTPFENYKIPALINKLSYKKIYSKYINNKITVYGKIIEG